MTGTASPPDRSVPWTASSAVVYQLAFSGGAIFYLYFDGTSFCVIKCAL